MQLVWPELSHLYSYQKALESGWSPNNVRGASAAREELAQIEHDPVAFIDSMVDMDASGSPITLPDGSEVNRLPGFRCWIWDGEFCGVIGFRWQPGTETLPPFCLGHIGFSVVAAKRHRGYATRALLGVLPIAKEKGLRYVELTTDPDNVASQRTISKAGGVLHERFIKPEQFGGTPGLRYRIALEPLISTSSLDVGLQQAPSSNLTSARPE